MSQIDCEHVLREVELFLDRELDEEEGRHIEEHLAECGDCLDKAEFRRRLRELIARKCGSEAVPPELLARIRTLLEAETPT